MSKFFALVFATLALSMTSAQAYESYGTCRAYTTCYNRFGAPAGTISCVVKGKSSAGVACQWYVQAYTSVSCSGFAYDQWGNFGWVNLSDSCARFW